MSSFSSSSRQRASGRETITIAGTPFDEISIDAQFDRSKPVPVTVSVEPGEPFVLGDVTLRGDAADLAPARFRLVPGGEVGGPLDQPGQEEILGRLLGAPDHRHLFIQVEELAAGQFAGAGGGAHWCTILVSVISDRSPMHPRCRWVTALLA
jgi:hypothetical protein